MRPDADEARIRAGYSNDFVRHMLACEKVYTRALLPLPDVYARKLARWREETPVLHAKSGRAATADPGMIQMLLALYALEQDGDVEYVSHGRDGFGVWKAARS